MIDMSGVVARALAILQYWAFLRFDFRVKTIVDFNLSSQKIQKYAWDDKKVVRITLY